MTSTDLKAIGIVSLTFFFLAAILGALMRFYWIVEIPFLEYKHLLHSHSHTALLGWAFISLAGTLVFFLVPKKVRLEKLKTSFIVLIVACLGMFFSFIYQGYGPISISFSALTLLIIYYFGYQFLQSFKSESHSLSKTFGKWAVYWLFVSTLGLWIIAPVEAFLGKLHPAYFGSIQFFLHFQFNGWITYGILALIFGHCENRGTPITLPTTAFIILQVSLILTYTLSVTWSTPENYLFYLNSVGVLLQVIAFYVIFKNLFKSDFNLFEKHKLSSVLLKMGLLSLLLKVLIQAAVAIPYIAKVSYTIRNFVIGFIHLTTIGSFTLVLLAIWTFYGILSRKSTTKIGFVFLIVGFISTELILFIQGILLWNGQGFIASYYELIFGTTLLLPIAISIILISLFKHHQKPLQQ